MTRRLEIDGAELQRRFYELSRRHHPDFHHGASPEAQAEALEASARLNAAYRALRDPIARIEYLVRLEEGRETREGAVVKPQAPPELLAEMFEIQESLAEAKSGALDEPTRETLRSQRERLRERHRDEEARLSGPLSQAWDAAAASAERAAALRAFKEALATRAYLRTVIADLGEALMECEPQDVAGLGPRRPRRATGKSCEPQDVAGALRAAARPGAGPPACEASEKEVSPPSEASNMR